MITKSIIQLLGSNDDDNLNVVKSLITNQSNNFSIPLVYDFVNRLLMNKDHNIDKLIFLQALKYFLANNGEYLFEMIDELNKDD